MLSNHFQNLEDLRSNVSKCPRCSLCKFPPLTRVESAKYSGICPSYEAKKFHSYSGGGMVVMGMSLLDGRSQVTPKVRETIFSCTGCGGCDVSCKYGSDIEVLEVIWQLRQKSFEEIGPLNEQKPILESLQTHGHPFATLNTSRKSGWIGYVDNEQYGSSDTLLWVGPHYGMLAEHQSILKAAVELLRFAQVSFQALGTQEPYTGRAAWEIGNLPLFRRFAKEAAMAIEQSGAKKVICLSAEDYSTLRSLIPRYEKINVPIRHITEVYADLVQKKKLLPKMPLAKTAVWHDPCYLGRLSESYQPWEGELKKQMGQLVVYDPPRPVNRGTFGCYEAPRQTLAKIAGLTMKEFYRQREYAFSSGETGLGPIVAPEVSKQAARTRLDEARDVGAEWVITECPQSLTSLTQALNASDRMAVKSLTQVLFESVRGGLS